MTSLARTIYSLYADGFRSMVLGRQLWKIILIKLVIIFGVIKIFFFPDFLATTYSSDHERANHVLSALTQDSTSAPHQSDAVDGP